MVGCDTDQCGDSRAAPIIVERAHRCIVTGDGPNMRAWPFWPQTGYVRRPAGEEQLQPSRGPAGGRLHPRYPLAAPAGLAERCRRAARAVHLGGDGRAPRDAGFAAAEFPALEYRRRGVYDLNTKLARPDELAPRDAGVAPARAGAGGAAPRLRLPVGAGDARAGRGAVRHFRLHRRHGRCRRSHRRGGLPIAGSGGPTARTNRTLQCGESGSAESAAAG
jgi:hypothetical protein